MAWASAQFYNPTEVNLDSNGYVYVADINNHLIRKISPSGMVSTVAGVAMMSGYVDGTSGTARFYSPHGVVVDTVGNIYVAEYNNHLIRKISPSGVVSTVAGVATMSGVVDGSGATAKFHYPTSIAVDISGNLFVVDYSNNRIRKITPI